MNLGRRDFLTLTLTVSGATLLGCGSTATGADSGPRPTVDSGSSGSCARAAGATGNAIDGHPGHRLSVPAGDLTSATPRTYDIQGSSAHTHTITLEPAQLATLAGGGSVVVTSTTGSGHTHNLTVTCS